MSKQAGAALLTTAGPLRESSAAKKRHKPLICKGLHPVPPRGVEQIANSSGNQGVALPSGAESGAVGGDSAPIDPDLAAVVAAWPGLPEAVRRKVVALVRR